MSSLGVFNPQLVMYIRRCRVSAYLFHENRPRLTARSQYFVLYTRKTGLYTESFFHLTVGINTPSSACLAFMGYPSPSYHYWTALTTILNGECEVPVMVRFIIIFLLSCRSLTIYLHSYNQDLVIKSGMLSLDTQVPEISDSCDVYVIIIRT